jgi:hypothetical protein
MFLARNLLKMSLPGMIALQVRASWRMMMRRRRRTMRMMML